jgi:hypothetical protein
MLFDGCGVMIARAKRGYDFTPMSNSRLHLCLVAGTAVRLLSTLLLGADGAIGLLNESWLVNFFYFFPNDPVRSITGGIIATVAPYAVYRLAQEIDGLRAPLTHLTSMRLLVLVLAYSIASPLLHHDCSGSNSPMRASRRCSRSFCSDSSPGVA